MLALRSPRGLSGSTRKWPMSPPPPPQGPWQAARGSRADTISSACLWQKPQGSTQFCLKPEALGSPGKWGHRGEKGEAASPLSELFLRTQAREETWHRRLRLLRKSPEETSTPKLSGKTSEQPIG